MDVRVVKKRVDQIQAPLVFFLTAEDADHFKKQTPVGAYRLIHTVCADGDFTGERYKTSLIRTGGITPAKKIFLIGLGEKAAVSKEVLRRASSVAIDLLHNDVIRDACFVLPSHDFLAREHVAASLCEGALLSDYAFDRYLSVKNKPLKIKTLSFVTTHDQTELEFILQRTKIICDNVLFVRNMSNENADVMTPLEMERLAKIVAQENNLKCTILDEKDLKKLGMNLILAVSKGSSYPPRFIILEYSGDKRSNDVYAFVGKGITFDSGGLDLKTADSMRTMKSDMSGAAAILGTIQAAAQLQLKKNILAVLPCCENAVDAKSYKPGDVYVSYEGKSVEIWNTDAEGRLILADALAYTERVLKPTVIIDLATLTGAVMISLGEWIAGLLTTDNHLAEDLFLSGEETSERVWRLPLYEEFKDEFKSTIADLPSMYFHPKRYAGAIYGAVFLSQFVEKTPWAHLDIAGTAWYEIDRYYTKKGGTGFGVRLLIDFLSRK